jgi:3-oxoacyl-[acyl-carrier-protein] synthase-3
MPAAPASSMPWRSPAGSSSRAPTATCSSSDTVSRILDWTDRATCVLFGDGAGAVVLQASENATGLLSSVLGSDGSGAEALYVPAGGARLPASAETLQSRQHYVKMNGNEVFRFAVHAMSRATTQAIVDAGLQPADIDLFIPHQANTRIIQAAAKALRLPAEKVFVNVDRYGNTSAASVPIALCEAIEQGRVEPGDRLALVGFGAGLTWAASVLQWGVPATLERPWWRHVLQGIWEREAVVRSFARRTGRRIAVLGRSNGRENGHG